MLITCPDCQKPVSPNAAACPHCGCSNPAEQIAQNRWAKMSYRDMLNDPEYQAKKDKEIWKRVGESLSGPKCPVCNSNALQRINAIEGVFMAGLAGASKRHKCLKCGHLFCVCPPKTYGYQQ